MKKIFVILPLILAILTTYPALSFAEPVNKQQAANIAVNLIPGRVIDVASAEQKGVITYHVKILDKKGGIHIVIVDAQSGNVLSAH